MEIKNATFLKSIGDTKDCPEPNMPEFAFIGRSNVGKSSLINMLCGKKELAKTSSTPGKTVSMNYFLIDEKWYIVDLPGYGYAKRSRTLREEWEVTLKRYLRTRPSLACLMLLIDARITPQKIDLDFIYFLGTENIPFSIVFTKLDKLKPEGAVKNIHDFCAEMYKSWEELPTIFKTSSFDKTGKEDILAFIDDLNKEFTKATKGKKLKAKK